MAVIKVRCKACKALLKFPTAKAGKRVRCPECDEIVRVPEDEAPAKEAIQPKKPAAPPPPPVPAPAPAAPAAGSIEEEEDDGMGKTYGLIAPADTPKLEDDEKPKKKKEEKKSSLAGRIKKRVVQDADQWQKINSALMLAFIGVCLMGIVALLNLVTFINGWFFNYGLYSVEAEKLLIQKVGTPVQTGAFVFTFGKNKVLQGVLANDDPIDPITGFVSKTFEQRLSTGGKYKFKVESTDFDAFVRVEDPNGRNLASNDNGAGGKDALLEFDAPGDGKYRVIVSSSINFPYEVNRNAFVVAMAYGSLEFGRSFLIIGSLASLGQIAAFMLAYFICLGVPNVNGTRAIALAMVGLGFVNLLLVFLLKLLPATGAFGYIMLPFVLPELAMTASNVERTQPLHIFWSPSPFWEMLASMIFNVCLQGEIILFCIFLRASAVAIKEEYLEERALGLVQLGFGVMFIYFAFEAVSVTGTSNVLLGLLRIIHGLYLGFAIGYVIYLAQVLLIARQKIETLLEPEEGAEGQSAKDDDDDDDDEEEDDEEDEEGDEDEEEDEDDDDDEDDD